MTAVTKPVVALLLLATQSDMSGLFSNATMSECTLNIAINMYRNNVEDSVAVTPANKNASYLMMTVILTKHIYIFIIIFFYQM